MGFKPLGDKVFVKFLDDVEKTAGGIYIPETAKEKPQRGKVEAVGKDVEELKVGDVVLFEKYPTSGSRVTIDDVEYLIVKEDDVLGIVS